MEAKRPRVVLRSDAPPPRFVPNALFSIVEVMGKSPIDEFIDRQKMDIQKDNPIKIINDIKEESHVLGNTIICFGIMAAFFIFR